jgi:hypothetical protein
MLSDSRHPRFVKMAVRLGLYCERQRPPITIHRMSAIESSRSGVLPYRLLSAARRRSSASLDKDAALLAAAAAATLDPSLKEPLTPLQGPDGRPMPASASMEMLTLPVPASTVATLVPAFASTDGDDQTVRLSLR